jgi:hypothetical protein
MESVGRDLKNDFES